MTNFSRVKIIKQALKQQMKEYFQNSTLHGIHYAADGSLHLLERLTWIIFCSVGMVSTAVIIALLWEKFQTHPTITGLDTDFHDWNVPFPAITLCMSHPHNEMHIEGFIRNMNLSHSNEAFKENYCNTLGSSDEQHTNNLQRKKYCFSHILTKLAGISYHNIEAFKEYLDVGTFHDGSLRSLAMEVFAHCQDIFKGCTWKGERLDSCCFPSNPNGLWPIFTDHGFCYTFNSQKTENFWPWLPEEVMKRLTLEIYETDDSWDFSFNVKDAKYFPVKVFIHDATDVPAAEFQPQHEWDGRTRQLVFSEKTTYTTLGARQLSISQRHCVFPDELHLKLDPEGYTYSGCLRECHADEAMRLCGCVPPFIKEMGKFRDICGIKRNYKQCDLSGLACLAEHKELLINCDLGSCELGCMNTVYEVEKLSGGFCSVADLLALTMCKKF